MASPVVRVGLAVILTQPSTKSILIGRRKGSHGAGKIQLPGGHLEMMESFEECAIRETLEETGLALKSVQLVTCTNDPMPDEAPPRHYVTVFMLGELSDPTAEPQLLEPHKCEGWEWVEWSKLASGQVPGPLFAPLANLIARGYSPFES